MFVPESLATEGTDELRLYVTFKATVALQVMLEGVTLAAALTEEALFVVGGVGVWGDGVGVRGSGVGVGGRGVGELRRPEAGVGRQPACNQFVMILTCMILW